MRQPCGSDGLAAVLRGYRREWLAVGVFSGAINLLTLTPSLYMLQVYDRVLVSGSALTLGALSLLALLLFVLLGLIEWARARLLVRLGQGLEERLHAPLFAAGFEAALRRDGRDPLEAFGDLAQLRQFLTGPGIFAFFDAPWTPIYLLVCGLLHPWLGLAALVFALAQAGVALAGHRLAREGQERLREAAGRMQADLRGKLRNAEAIAAMGMLPQLGGRRRRLAGQLGELRNAQQDRNQRIQALGRFFQYAQQSLILAVGAWLVARGELSPGAMIAANLLLVRALQPVQQVVGGWRGFLAARSAHARLSRLLAAYPAAATAVSPPLLGGPLELRGLVARATGRPRPILQGLDAVFNPGEIVLAVGPSGSGKSTLARCLVGVWPETEGEIRFAGQSLAAWSRATRGPHVGYMPQDVELLEGSVAENIARFGRLEPDKVVAAASAAGIHEMILRFPEGYDTQIGPGGASLSAGQRQRIALARALYGDPALVVLDEPNAHLDDAGEAALAQALLRLKAMGRVVFLISHRPAVLAIADRLLVLRDGRIQSFGARTATSAAVPVPV